MHLFNISKRAACKNCMSLLVQKHGVNGCISIIQIALVNNFLKLGLNELKLCFRVRLTKHLYDEYLK